MSRFIMLAGIIGLVSVVGCSGGPRAGGGSSSAGKSAAAAKARNLFANSTPKPKPKARKRVSSYGGQPAQTDPDDAPAAARFRYQQRLSADGTVPDNALLRAKGQRDALLWQQRSRGDGGEPAFARFEWLGPGNVGGRLRAILVHPEQPDTLWIGSAGGGIWKTTDGGANWSPLDDFLPSLSIGCMALDPQNPDVIYAGTGEGFFNTVEGTSNTAAIRGAGIFRSTDGGATWAHLESTGGPEWYFVNRLAIDPEDTKIMLAATENGIYRTIDGGDSWTRTLERKTLDVKLDPTDSSKAVAGGVEGDARYSTDGGETWSDATGVSGDRVELAYAPSDPSIVYAAVARNWSLSVYRSTDGGKSFSRRGGGIFTLANYTGVIWVDPTSAGRILVGGQYMARSIDGGLNLYSAFGGVHPDMHVIATDPRFDGTDNRTIFVGCDGGIYRIPDARRNDATALNSGLGITQFYGAAVNPTTGVVVGGTQDNGTLRYSGDPQKWSHVIGGDGGFCASDPGDSSYFYGEYQRAEIQRSKDGGKNFTDIGSGISDGGGLAVNFIPYFMLDPNEPRRMLVAAERLWRSNNVKAQSPTWSVIKNSIKQPGPGRPPREPPRDHFDENSPFNISTIAVAEGNSDVVWVGYNNGEVWKTLNGTNSKPDWTQVDGAGGNLPDRWISRIVIDPANHDRVYASVMGWEPDNVWRTEDGGDTWTDITGGGPARLPSAPVSAIALHRTQPGWLYVGTDIGVYASSDDGASWSATTVGPATATIDELVWKNDDTMLIVTHGRGVYLGTVGPFAGDLNCDGYVDFEDIDPFVLAIIGGSVYGEQYPDCNPLLADINGDRSADFDDIDPFVECLANEGCP
jgi:photosystem II stability/assembly factor-like uncharacterized protein